MSLRKVWTTQYQRYGRASYAEQNDQFIDVIVAEIIVLMADPASRFYKVEVKENGAFVGYFIIRDGTIMKYHIRPHFLSLTDDFNILMAEVQSNTNFSATVGSDNIN
jgi:hypothetical protein